MGVGPVVVDGFYGPQTKAAVKEIADGFEGTGPHSYRINNGFWTLLSAASCRTGTWRSGRTARS